MSEWRFEVELFLDELARRGRTGAREVVAAAGLDSSSTELIGRVANGAKPGTVVVAGSQRLGRGRQGRKWHSPPSGNLYLSLAVSLWDANEKAIRFVPLAAGVAVVDAVCAMGVAQAELKWPNDVLVEGRKLAGILCEIPDLSKRPLAIAVGVGLNIASVLWPKEIEAASCSLADWIDAEPRLEVAAAACVAGIENGIARVDGGDTAGVLASWRKRGEAFGRRVSVNGVIGNTVDLDPDGQLLVQKDNGEIVAISGGTVETI